MPTSTEFFQFLASSLDRCIRNCMLFQILTSYNDCEPLLTLACPKTKHKLKHAKFYPQKIETRSLFCLESAPVRLTI